MSTTNSLLNGDLLLDDNHAIVDEVINDVRQMKVNAAKMKEYVSDWNRLIGMVED